MLGKNSNSVETQGSRLRRAAAEADMNMVRHRIGHR